MAEAASQRLLATVLFTDIADSTAQAAHVGDDRWIRLLDDHDALVRRLIAAAEGREVNTTGDGFVAMFNVPLQAVRCAGQIVQDAAALGLRVRAGLHTGEVQQRGRDISGIAVHTAARIAEQADGGEVLLSGTVRDLVAGTDVRTTSVARVTLRGLPGRRTLHRLVLAGESAKVSAGGGRGAAASVARTAKRGTPQPARAKPARGKIRVLVVDDHPLWRETLVQVLRGAGLQVVADVSDADAAVRAVAQQHPDVVIMDLELMGASGIDATAAILVEQPDLKVLFLSSSDNPAHVLGALRTGASGYLVKTAGATEIATAVQRIAAGELVVPPQLSTVVLAELRQPAATAATSAPADSGSALAALTRRELDVLGLIADGMSNQSIAEALHLTVKTVEGHVSNLFAKLGLETGSGAHRRVRAATIFRSSSGAKVAP